MELAMRRLALLIALCFALGLAVASAEDECYYPGFLSPEGVHTMAHRDVVDARVVFVYFPPPTVEQADSLLPAWGDSALGECRSFIRAMSRGQQDLRIKTAKRLGADSIYAWRADSVATQYQSSSKGWERLNKQIMLKVHNAYRNAAVDTLYWGPINQVFILPYEKTSPASWGGIASLSNNGTTVSVPGFQEALSGDDKRGVTQRLNRWDNFTVNFNDRVPACLAHEYGHILFQNGGEWAPNGHSPLSGNPPYGTSPQCGNPWSEYINMGKYDMMRGISGTDKAWIYFGLAPYHPVWLVKPDLYYSNVTWVPQVVLTADVRGLHVPQIRGTNATVYRINTSIGDQYFQFANFQGTASSRFDAKLGGTGLLVWHIVSGAAWDLESARGKKPGVGVAGLDSLEANWCYLGDPKDFFSDSTSAGGQNFSITTNPNTNLYYMSNPYIYPQDVRTSIALENIRRDPTPGSTDMLVDAFVDSKQYVSSPNGGEAAAAGDSLAVTWDERPYANIYKVDVALSTNGGSSFTTLASDQPNTGSYAFVPSSVSTQCRIRVTSYDSLTSAVDASDANFTLAVVSQSSVAYNSVQVQVDSFTVNLTWNTLVATQSSGDQVRFYRTQTGGTPISPSAATYTTSQGGLAHTAACIITPCDSEKWWYEVKSTNKGVTHWSTRTATTCFKVNACIEP
jgi:hypothetical protein